MIENDIVLIAAHFNICESTQWAKGFSFLVGCVFACFKGLSEAGKYFFGVHAIVLGENACGPIRVGLNWFNIMFLK